MPGEVFPDPTNLNWTFFLLCVLWALFDSMQQNKTFTYISLFVSSLASGEQRPRLPCLPLSRQPPTKQVQYEYECVNREL